MKAENKRSWMVWAIVILAVMNLSTILTVIILQNQSRKAGSFVENQQQQEDFDADKFSGRYFQEKLDFEYNQMEKFQEINPVFRKQAKAINDELSQIRKQMLAEMVAEKSDTNKLNALSDSIGNLHGTLKKNTYKYYLDIKNICNSKQRKELELLFSETFSKEIPSGQGKRWRYRGQHGKRNNN
jgi:Spy/CpxP family protein refolding chaperone